MRANEIGYVDPTFRYCLKFQMEAGGNWVETAVISFRHLCFGKEENVKFRGIGIVFHRMEIRAKITNVQFQRRWDCVLKNGNLCEEIDEEKVGRAITTPTGSTDKSEDCVQPHK